MVAPHEIISLTPTQYLTFIKGTGAIVYQFNREFYCIKDHDKEVSCMGILFFGNAVIPHVRLDQQEAQQYQTLHEILLAELENKDTIQAEMLRILLKRFIIKTTRLIKIQDHGILEDLHYEKLQLLRNFNILVETHFRQEHRVSFYADQLYKSAKTLSNSFSKHHKSPLQIIHDRIILETKRLLSYTEKSAKEIGFELGFDDPSHLSRLFKKHTGFSPSAFRKNKQQSMV